MSESMQPESATETLHVELGSRRYPIHIGTDVPIEIAPLCGKGAWIIDPNVGFTVANSDRTDLCFQIPRDRLGESAKSLALLGEIYEFLAENGVGRDGFLVAVGGGVTGDLGGFAAASYLRGIDFYQVPTTLLAMVDSSVGGKTGINIRAGKNLVGAFWQPRAVFVSTRYLRTLPRHEFSAGMAEVIKYGMLCDRALFDELSQLDTPLDADHPRLPTIIRRCCEIKAEIVRADEKETATRGGRALLNLGHTFAHAIENVAGYGTYLHGEAVAVGLVLAARLSEELTKEGRDGFAFSAGDVAAVIELIDGNGLPTTLRDDLLRDGIADQPAPKLPVERLLEAMMRDKKVKGGQRRFVALERLGEAVIVAGIDESCLRDLWLEAGAQA